MGNLCQKSNTSEISISQGNDVISNKHKPHIDQVNEKKPYLSIKTRKVEVII